MIPLHFRTASLKKKKKSSKNISQNILQTKLKLYIAIHSVQFVNVKYNVNINVSLFRFFKFIFMNSCLFAGIFPQSLLLNNNSFFFFPNLSLYGPSNELKGRLYRSTGKLLLWKCFSIVSACAKCNTSLPFTDLKANPSKIRANRD